MTRILIVEDDEVLARSLARAFTRRRPDFAISVAPNGFEATKVMSRKSVDLVLTDIRMPHMDGFTLLTWMLDHHPGVPVFAMSGQDTDDDAQRLSGMGAIKCFKKPIDECAVLSCMAEALDHSVRGHVHNLSLASFLQLMEMEKKSCRLTISAEDKIGVLMIREGELIDAQVEDLRGEAAAIAIIAWQTPSIAIGTPPMQEERTIERPTGFIVMEAMRAQDEAARQAGTHTGHSSVLPAKRTWIPSRPAPAEPPAPLHLALPKGAVAIAVVDTATGTILTSSEKDGCPVTELAQVAALVLRQQQAMLELCGSAQEGLPSQIEDIEELVLSTSTHCDLIRPLGTNKFALLVYMPDETNLVMARFELTRCLSSTT